VTATTAHLGEPIAHGRTADVYAWKERWVLKLFHEGHTPQDVQHEARIARAVHRAGLPVPAVGQVVETQGRPGLVYERIDGLSMLEEIETQPWKVLSSARLLAELHIGVHSREVAVQLPSQREQLARKIQQARGLGAKLQETGLKNLEGMPGGDRLCHGDFHPGNVIVSSRGPVIIDWIDATVGNPLADVARTSVIMLGVRGTEQAPWSQRMVVRWYHRIYLIHYLRLASRGAEEHTAWYPIVAAARMSEGITEIEDWLLAQVRAGLR